VFSTGDDYDFEGSTWWNSTWGYRKLITINSSQVDADLNNFPILVNITDTDLRDDAQNDGDDIAFILWSDNSTQLNHEIELFNGTTGELAVWVNVTSISSSINTKIWMYYNNSGASSQQNPTGVWDSNYEGVWHLSEDGTGTRNDSTSHGRDAATSGYDNDEQDVGIISNADHFDGTDDYLDVTGYKGVLGANARTVELWYKSDTAGGRNDRMVSWGTNTNEQKYDLRSDDSNSDSLRIENSGGQKYSSTDIMDQSWHYLVTTFEDDGTPDVQDHNLYVDGGLETVTGGGSQTMNTVADDNVWIGDSHWHDNPTDGILDEVRISNISRNSSWINTCYNTITNTTTFISIGSESVNTDTSVDTISPYTITSSPLIINATGSSDLDNVTLWYHWSSDNFTMLGTGKDGAKTITADDTIINNYTYLTGNENSAETTITVNDASEFNVGDEILIIQMQNSSGGIAGTYEFATISSISENNITLDSGLTNSYYSGTFNQSSATAAQIISVPHYTTVTVNSNANITASAWDGYDGGIVVFRAIGGVTVNGAINVSEKGYRGGLHGTSW